jgi:hypothetical protein
MAAEDVPEVGRQAMLELFGCHRPDKRHHLTAEGAAAWLEQCRRSHTGDTYQANVYRCCDAGWVFGRRHRTE